MPTDITSDGPWKGVEDHQIRAAFMAYMRESAYPERFSGVAERVKPPTDRDFRIIKKRVSVNPSNRGDTYVPCNLCGPNPKFKTDGMLILDDQGWLYLIGPICGRKHYEERFVQEERRFDREQAKQSAERFLMDSVERISFWQREARALGPHARAAKKAHVRLAKSGKAAAQLRRAFAKDGGRLYWHEARRALRANGGDEVEHHQVLAARINGSSATRTQCFVDTRLNDAALILEHFGLDEDAAVERIAEAESLDELPELAAALRGAVATLGAVRADIEDFQACFSVDNFRAIEMWAADGRCPVRLHVECRGDTRMLALQGARRRHIVDVAELMRPLHVLRY